MAIKYEKILAGMVLYDRHRHRIGNTTATGLGEWPVRVAELVPGEPGKPWTTGAMVSWNTNPVVFWSTRRLAKLFSWSMHDSTECRMLHGRPVRHCKGERGRLKREREMRRGGA